MTCTYCGSPDHAVESCPWHGTGHAPTAPSAAARRNQCSQSTTLEAIFPEEDTPESREGTAAHWAVSEQLSGRAVDVGLIAPNGVPLTDEMIDAADVMVNDVTDTLALYGREVRYGHVEQRVGMPRIHPTQFGSPDYYNIVGPCGVRPVLLLWDFKYGHRHVDAFENDQMVDYLAGILEGFTDAEIIVRIVQPRSYSPSGPISEWRTTLAAIQHLIERSSAAAHEALGPNPRARTGPECRDCRARHACPALQARGFAGMDEAKRVTPLVMEPAGACLELALLDESIELMKARRSGLALQVEAWARKGQPTPGWRLESGTARELWKVPAATVIAIGNAMRLDLAKPVEPITPTQARAAGLDPNIVAELAKRGPAGMSLVVDDGSKARPIFC